MEIITHTRQQCSTGLSSTKETKLDQLLNEEFSVRHIGPSENELQEMLKELHLKSVSELIDKTVPTDIRLQKTLDLPTALSEKDALNRLRSIVSNNKVFKSYIGMGYNGCFTPSVILRNVLENPSWYTQYTPYQAEISQGRLEALLNFQTMVTELTGMELANASLLDEATAAAEAMTFCWSLCKDKNKDTFFISELCHPQTIEVVQTRALPMGIKVIVGDHNSWNLGEKTFAVLLQYPASNGALYDYKNFTTQAHDAQAMVAVCADILSLTVLTPPGEWGADVVVGSTQRFGVPMGFGGPHAAYFATHEKNKRRVPGRIVGVSKDSEGNRAVRLALQTREQHIRRDKATSNICTAQVLLAIMASMYAVYHGPDGLKRIASRVAFLANYLKELFNKNGDDILTENFFDTIQVRLQNSVGLKERLHANHINLRFFDSDTIGISLDETTTLEDVHKLFKIISNQDAPQLHNVSENATGTFQRSSAFMTQPVFNSHLSETEMLRYIKILQDRDLSLTTSMIPLGSCTMKLNATSEMLPITWPEIANIHPFASSDQTTGYQQIINELENWLAEITGFAATSMQPNAGSQGEYAGLLCIQKYHESQNQKNRNICLIPVSAHGTNPASAVMAGLKVVPILCDEKGNINIEDLKQKAQNHKDDLASLMITYPSTHGVFEETIQEICTIVHDSGGLVYLDGANMNAMVGLSRPGDFGADVCHLNLHKTFCIPHGGGGPGMGPICVNEKLKPHLPGYKTLGLGDDYNTGAISAAPYGSPSILPISWMYIAMMGAAGLKKASEVAILNANYIAQKLEPYFPVLYKGRNGYIAHECIIDLRPIKNETDIAAEDIAKRLMDYGFHAPTLSWPVIGTMMIEPTESESKAELDRFCEAMISIHAEIQEIKEGKVSAEESIIRRAPHTAKQVTADNWDRPYTRQRAAFPTQWTETNKFWPYVSRINNAFGDKNLVCSCDGFFDDLK